MFAFLNTRNTNEVTKETPRSRPRSTASTIGAVLRDVEYGILEWPKEDWMRNNDKLNGKASCTPSRY